MKLRIIETITGEFTVQAELKHDNFSPWRWLFMRPQKPDTYEWHTLDMFGRRFHIFHGMPIPPAAKFSNLDEAKEFVERFKTLYDTNGPRVVSTYDL
jgi:hypothetical protein